MPARLDRRQFVLRSGQAALGLPLLLRGSLGSAAALFAEPRKFRGIFAILETPFNLTDAIDEEDLAREVDFCVRGGAHGLVWPQLAAEFYLLLDEERMRGAEVIIKAAAGRRPVVIGVQAPVKELAVKLARHAESKGADAVIALPPYLGHAGLDTAADYYRSLAHAVGIPIFIQNSGGAWGPAMPTDFVIRLARELPQLGYIKEEVEPVGHRLSEYARSGVMSGIFSGSAGRNLLNELPRGSSGTMPACEFIDVDAQVYDLAAAGKSDEAHQLFQKLLPMINLEETYGMPFAKAVLVRRGVFKTAKMRGQTGAALDQFDEDELASWWKQLEPYFKA
ncbi:MAG TPA: dihydrodipicolinate synthase family protein [Terriglobia bacterium]|nr:dihydrodipicolinate synthase family protein [Terriglobia bacterium]